MTEAAISEVILFLQNHSNDPRLTLSHKQQPELHKPENKEILILVQDLLKKQDGNFPYEVASGLLLLDDLTITKDQFISLASHIKSDSGKDDFNFLNTAFHSWSKNSQENLAKCSYDELLEIYNSFSDSAKKYIEHDQAFGRGVYFNDMLGLYLQAIALSKPEEAMEIFKRHIGRSYNSIGAQQFENMLFSTGVSEPFGKNAIDVICLWIRYEPAPIKAGYIAKLMEKISDPSSKVRIGIEYIKKSNEKISLEFVFELMNMSEEIMKRTEIAAAYLDNPNTKVTLNEISVLLGDDTFLPPIIKKYYSNPNTVITLADTEELIQMLHNSPSAVEIGIEHVAKSSERVPLDFMRKLINLSGGREAERIIKAYIGNPHTVITQEHLKEVMEMASANSKVFFNSHSKVMIGIEYIKKSNDVALLDFVKELRNIAGSEELDIIKAYIGNPHTIITLDFVKENAAYFGSAAIGAEYIRKSSEVVPLDFVKELIKMTKNDDGEIMKAYIEQPKVKITFEFIKEILNNPKVQQRAEIIKAYIANPNTVITLDTAKELMQFSKDRIMNLEINIAVACLEKQQNCPAKDFEKLFQSLADLFINDPSQTHSIPPLREKFFELKQPSTRHLKEHTAHSHHAHTGHHHEKIV